MNRLGTLEEALYKATIPPPLLLTFLPSLVSLALIFSSTVSSFFPPYPWVVFSLKVLSPYAQLWHFGDCTMTVLPLGVSVVR